MNLSAEDRAELERISRAATSTQRAAGRARIILECERGGSAEVIGERLGTSPSRVERWRSRFLRDGLAGLEDRPRPGHPPQFGPLVHAELIALACEPRGELEKQNGKNRRTLEDVRQEAIRRQIVPSISWTSVQRILAGLDIRPHVIEQWIHSPDPCFREKVAEITDLYLHPPPNSVVLSIDEKTGMQALERRFPDRLPGPGRPRRQEFEYKRRGTQALICSFEVGTGTVLGSCGDTRTGEDLVRFMEAVAGRYPTGAVHVIWDNLNIHFDGADGRWTEFNHRHGERFVFHYTPKHASWMNQIELFFGILERLSLRHASFSSKEELRATVLAFLDYWNRERAHPFRWTFTGFPLQSGTAELARPAA